ncbi:MAG TPA: ester cyclase [Thermomicrobiales bacterium]|nr:ester cyclase [Thermomicrobiales bacterium]
MTAQDNKEVILRWFAEAWNKGNIDVADEIVTDDYVGYVSGNPGPMDGRGPLQQFVTDWRTAFPDVHYTVHDVIGEGDMTLAYWTASGTHTGPMLGIPPTGRKVTIEGATISRYRDGQVVVGRGIFDRLDILQQLGVMPPTSAIETPAARILFWAIVNRNRVGLALVGATVLGILARVVSSSK